MMTITDYAKRRGVSAPAVSKAIKAGRLERSVVRDRNGNPKIGDADLADEEWSRNTAAPSQDPVESAGVPAFAVSRARREAARAGLATLELMKARGTLVNVEGVRAAVGAKFSEVRTKLLAVPDRLRQQCPDVAPGHVAVVDDLIRSALEALANEAT